MLKVIGDERDGAGAFQHRAEDPEIRAMSLGSSDGGIVTQPDRHEEQPVKFGEEDRIGNRGAEPAGHPAGEEEEQDAGGQVVRERDTRDERQPA
jgi:hypothetical protein